jgi:probable rRNA maturation factor
MIYETKFEPLAAHIIEISIQDPAWEKLEDVDTMVRNAAYIALDTAILPKIAQDRQMEASIVLANDDLLHILNREYRDKDEPTNILTFAALDAEEPESDGVLQLGDIMLSYETIRRQAREEGKFMKDHVKHMVVHGVLHLLGYDHETDDQATDMETLEIRILERLGVQNPYTLD